jgi:hypothetical protein
VAIRDWLRRTPTVTDPDVRTAAVQQLGGPTPQMGSRAVNPAQRDAQLFARRIGFVRNSYRFLAHQGARCPWRPEYTVNGVDWIPAGNNLADGASVDELAAWDALALIRPARGSQSDLAFASMFLDETVGEFMIVRDPDRPDGSAAFSARSPLAVEKEKRRGGGWIVKTQPGGTPRKGTAFVVPSLWRHWQADETYEDVATSSLLGMVDDCRTYWTLIRQQRRELRSRLSMNKMLWVEAAATKERATDDQGRPLTVSLIEKRYAEAATKRVNDEEDMEVASVAPWLFWTGGDIEPKLIDLGAMDPLMLDQLRDTRELIAGGLPLSTQSILDGEQQDPNHWNKWAADDSDIEVVESTARRSLEAWSEAVFRPMLEALAEVGLFGQQPIAWRIGADFDAIRARVDNSENARFALDGRYIGLAAGLDALHFDEGDLVTDADLALYAKIEATKPKPPGPLGAGPGQPAIETTGTAKPGASSPEQPVPEEQQAGLVLVDDRYLLS